MATITLADRILDFFNTVNDPYEIRYRIKDDPNFGSAPASGYGITLPTAQNILTARAELTLPPNPVPNPDNMFDSLDQIDAVLGVGPATLHNILYSFSESLRSWTASSDGQRVGTLRDVGIGTLVAEEKLQVYDGALSVTSYRDTPGQVAVLGTPGSAFDLFVLGKHAYVADGPRFTVFDISNPSAPTLLKSIGLNDARGVFVSGNYAYVADGSQGLQIIDISDPANPSVVGNYNTDGNAMGVWVVGDYAYAADDARGLQIIDVSDPASPSLVDNYDTDGNAEDVYVAGNYAFVADGSEGLQILDINPDNPPTLVSSFDTDGDCRCVYIHGDRAYVADGSKGFQIFDISNPVDLKQVGSFSTAGGQADDIFVSGNHAYVANGTSGVQVFDISDLASPKLVDTFDPTGGDARGIFVSGNYAYVADEDLGMIVYHVLNTSRIGADSHFGGNVGIGTEPQESYKLDVDGDINATDFLKNGEPLLPIGSIIAWHRELLGGNGGEPSVPFGWALCDGQTIEDPDSPLNGIQIPDLNGDGKFLRGGKKSGTMQADQMQSHTHDVYGMIAGDDANSSGGGSGYGFVYPHVPGYPGWEHNLKEHTDFNEDPVDSGTGAGKPRHGVETRPINMSVVWIMKIK